MHRPFDRSSTGSLGSRIRIEQAWAKENRRLFVELATVVDRFPHSPVHQHRIAVTIDHDVIWFDVTVNHIVIIKCILDGIADIDKVSK